MKLFEYLEQPFVQNAILVGVLISLCASLLGVTLVLKRFSFIGDGLSHIAFFSTAIAGILHLTQDMLITLPVTIICATLLLKSSTRTRIKGDASLAMISVGTLAGGYTVMNVFPKSSNVSGDVCGTLFGSTSILTLTQSDVLLCIILSSIVIFMFIFFYNKIFAVTFDDTFARGTGVRSDLYNFIIAAVTASIITIAINLVGALLITALVVFPALSSMHLFKSFLSVTICSAIISVVCALLGLGISIEASTPVGSTIVIVNALAFFLCEIISFFIRRHKNA